MTKYADLFAALAAPFPPDEIKTRSQGGRVLQYITPRTAQIRFDEVLGPENWWPAYTETKGGLKCAISIRLPDGEVVTKEDGGGFAGMQEADNDQKSGYSDAFKRAASVWGVARDLYGSGVAEYGPDHPHQPAAQPQPRRDDPREQVVDRYTQHRQDRAPQGGGNGQGNGQRSGPPRSGKGLFAWTKEQEQQYGVTLLKPLNAWAKDQGYPYKMTEYDAEQVGRAHAEACRLLQSFNAPVHAGGGDRPDYDDADAPAF